MNATLEQSWEESATRPQMENLRIASDPGSQAITDRNTIQMQEFRVSSPESFPYLAGALDSIIMPNMPSVPTKYTGMHNDMQSTDSWQMQFDQFGFGPFFDTQNFDPFAQFDGSQLVDQQNPMEGLISTLNPSFLTEPMTGIEPNLTSFYNNNVVQPPFHTMQHSNMVNNHQGATSKHSTLYDLNNYFRTEFQTPWSKPEHEITRLTRLNDSVTCLCDLMDNILSEQQHQQSQKSPKKEGYKSMSSKDFDHESSITVMLAFTSVSMVLRIYRAWCQMFLDTDSSRRRSGDSVGMGQRSSSTSSASSVSSRSSAKSEPPELVHSHSNSNRRMSEQVKHVAQLAIIDFHLERLWRFFHAHEFTSSVPPMIIQSAVPCFQDLRLTIQSLLTSVKAF